MYSSHVDRPLLFLAALVGMCLVAQTSQAIIVNPGVVFQMRTVDTAYTLSIAMHFDTIHVRAAELILDQLHLQFSPGAGHLAATFDTINPTVMAGNALRWSAAMTPAVSGTAWFNLTGLRAEWQYTLWIDGSQVTVFITDAMGGLGFYRTGSWSSSHTLLLVAAQQPVTGITPPQAGGGTARWVIFIVVVMISGGLIVWALSRREEL